MNEFYRMAVRNIAEKGDTDIFPFPVERYLFQDRQKEILRILSDMDSNYESLIQASPIDCIKACVPHNYRGFRWATMIDPLWNAFFLGEVLKISSQIENMRIPVKEKCVFSYRLKYDKQTGLLFDPKVSFKSYTETSEKMAEKCSFIINFDISNFYNCINHERLKEILLDDVKADSNEVARIMELISGISGKGVKFGLPIGGNASRILAEAYLIRSDNFMKENGIRFCRFVDDFYVYADSRNDAFSILNRCADFFQRYLELTFQKSKTSIMSKKDFRAHSESVLDEIKRENDPARASILSFKRGVDKYLEMGNEEMRDLRGRINGSELVTLLKLECTKTEINQTFSKQLVNAVQVIDRKNQSLAFEVLSENFDKLYPVFPVIMRRAYYNLPYCSIKAKKAFFSKLAELFGKNSYIVQTANNASYALRVLSKYDNRHSIKIIDKVYSGNSEGNPEHFNLVKANAIYAMTNLGNIPWLRERLENFRNLSSWERRAIAASTALLEEKGKQHTGKHFSSSSLVENLMAEWAYEKLSLNPDWRLPL